MADTVSSSLVKPTEMSLIKAQEELLHSPLSSDLTITCGTRTWKCQRVILTQRCAFFRALCGGLFKESETNTIKLDDDAPRSVEMLLLYLYTLAVPDFKDKQFGGQWTAAEAAYKTGDRYGVPGLRDAGHSFMLSLINKDLATWHKSTDANQSSWIIRITRVWQWDNESAQDLKVAMIKSLVICSTAIIEDESFRQLLKDKEDFALAFLRAVTKEANRH